MNLQIKHIRSLTLFAFLCVLFTGMPSIAQEELSGAQSGTLPAGLYDVVDDISVEPFNNWYLDPGVELRFQSGTSLDVRGLLVAEGTESDSIRFSRYNENEPWSGIDIYGWGYARFIHAVITGSNRTAIYGYNNGKFYMSDSRISNNSDINDDYAGIHSESALFDTLWSTTISDNDGIGYYWWNCFADIRDCVFSGNTGSSAQVSYGNGSIKNTQFIDNFESGFYNHASSVDLDSCEFIGNTAVNGAAIRTSGGFSTVTRTVFTDNHATNNGGAIMLEYYIGGFAAINCIFDGNLADGHGAATYSEHIIVYNSIFCNNTGDAALYFIDWGNPTEYCLFYGNDEDLLTELSNDFQFGELTTENVNGDSCDQWYNLFIDPLFDLSQETPYHLLADSPAIDAGNPEDPFDPDDTIADIGIHFYDHSGFVEDSPVTQVPGSGKLLHAWPNPFNSTVRLSFETPIPGAGSYAIYTTTGQLVESGTINMRRGYNEITWNPPEALASGLYIFTLQDGSNSFSRRLTFIK